MKKTKHLIVLLGPTGVGKTDLSIDIAKKFQTCIISSDSRQMFKEMKIGTAVPSDNQIKAVKHYFIQNKSIFDYYNASKFEFEVIDLLKQLFQDKKVVLMSGGSGFYIDAVCKGIDELPEVDIKLRENLKKRLDKEGIESLRFDLKKLDPEYYKTADLKNPKRILKALEISIMTGKPYSSFRTNPQKKRNFNTIKIGLFRDRQELYQRINKRVDIMLEKGLFNEVKQLFPYHHLNALNTVGYKEFFAHLQGHHSFEKAVELVKRNSRRYAKRQLSWFKRDKEIKWFHPEQQQEIIAYIESKIKTHE